VKPAAVNSSFSQVELTLLAIEKLTLSDEE